MRDACMSTNRYKFFTKKIVIEGILTEDCKAVKYPIYILLEL